MHRLIDSNKRKVSSVILLALLVQLLYPVSAFALTGGPSQPEYESFEPAGATEMVNLATGDFVYNIPLLDVDGYPVNMSYHGGVNMEQEASWVGLGWSLNPGAINRGLRGLPDDFSGGSDRIDETVNIKANKTYGANVGGGFEVAGFDFLSLGLNAGLGILYNNYKGLGFELDLGVSGGIQASAMGQSAGLSGGLGLKVSNQDGADFSMSGGLGVQLSAGVVNGSIGVNRMKVTNSRRGLTDDIISGSASMGVSIRGISFGTGTGSSINLIPNTAYVPNMQYPTTFSGITGEIHAGGEFFWCNAHGYLRAYKFEQGIAGNNFSRDAYGYMNLEKGNSGSMLDFNRDNDGVYYLECPKLPFSSLTYDVFNASAQGLSELFRPYRNDMGYVFDPIVTGGGYANDIGIEGNYGSYFEIGFNDYGVSTNSIAGPWLANNLAYSNGLRFSGDNQLTNDGTKTYEHSFFKALDEMTIEDLSFYNSVMGKDLSAFKLLPMSGSVNSLLSNTLLSSSGSTTYSGQKKQSREARNTNMSYLTVADATVFGVSKQLSNYTANTFNYTSEGDINTGSYPVIARNQGLSGNNHHMSEISVLKEDGSRYIYGLPVYNRTQKEVIFNCQGNVVSADNLVTYNYTGSNPDNSVNNNKGRDNFYLKRNVPAYAHSYLLTSLLSSDYVDITGDGITNDDYGDYTKFNYSKASSAFSWRNPCTPSTGSTGQAVFDDGWRADNKDDKGVIVYGEKDLWYVHSIETKNYVAEFYTSGRDDAHGVTNENGGISTAANNTSQKLDKIVLYSKKDRTTPIKTVNFVYSYKLCPNTPNSISSASNPTKGKLTLERVYFTYGKSDKSVFSPYVFTYCDFNQDGVDDAGLNPSFDRSKMDRWGNYQQPSGPFSNSDFPYTQQVKTVADNNSSVWSLSSVITPAKSRLNIYYESDDYAFIQDQVPGQMLPLVGYSQTKPSASYVLSNASPDLFGSSSPFTPNNYMIVDLTRLSNGGLLANSVADAETILRNKMLPATGHLYFKCLVQLNTSASTKEYVPGYAGFDRTNSGIISTGSTPVGSKTLYKYAFVRLNDVDIEDPKNYAGDNCNPVSKAAWQITRLYHPQIAYPGSEPGGSGLSAIAGLIGAIGEVFSFKEKNNRLRKKGYGRSSTPALSFVRMLVPTKTKFGGGHRVKKIEIYDNWNNMVPTEAGTTYGQVYTYEKTEAGESISSGVSSYEPLAGGDEISLREPVEYSVERIAAPNDAHFFEKPTGEAFYPASTVIYSKVAIRNIDRYSGPNLIAGNIGRTEYEFYTSRDFPISGAYDGLQSYVHTPDPQGDLFNNYLESSVHLSQGFILRLNNMHGKLKSMLIYQEGNNNPVSGTRYIYKTTSNSKELDNLVDVIDENGNISNKLIGQHVEAVADFRMQNSQTFANTISGNLNVSPLPIPLAIPIPIPSFYWGTSTETRDFYSSTFNKIVTQQGILSRIETVSDFATATTENLVFDERTQDVILTRTSTKYKDHDYSYHTPAHWVYKGMGGAFKNIHYGFKNVITLATGAVTLSNGLLFAGDEVGLFFTNSSDNQLGTYFDKLWISRDGSGNLQLINRDGKICNTSGLAGSVNVFAGAPAGTSNYVLKVLRSGYKNILDQAVEEIDFSADPRTGSTVSLTKNVLDAVAKEYSSDWQQFCPYYDEVCLPQGSPASCSNAKIFANTNPYVRNSKGNWHEVREYSYVAKRLAKDQLTNVMDIRKDGTYETYKPFFLFNTTWKEVYNTARTDYNASKPFDNWIMMEELTKVSPYGNLLEAKDGLNRYSSYLYGYNHTLKTAQVSNAKQREVGFDNFEDYLYGTPCTDNHFNFKKYQSKLASGIAHSGRYSLKVSPAECIQINKQISYKDCSKAYGSNNVFGKGTYTATEPPIEEKEKEIARADAEREGRTLSCDCISDFSPVAENDVDQKYILSVWVKEEKPNKDANYTSASVAVLIGVTPVHVLVGKSGVINGWQKMDYEFTVPAGTAPGTISFKLINTGSGLVFFDDIRVQPFNASMDGSVFDPLSLRLWAELDERNFATFYEYDNEGILVRVKKETELGIQTLKETRNSLKKQ